MVSAIAASPQCCAQAGMACVGRHSCRRVLCGNAAPKRNGPGNARAVQEVEYAVTGRRQRKKSSFSAPNMDEPQLRPNLPTLFATWVRPALMSSHALLIG